MHTCTYNVHAGVYGFLTSNYICPPHTLPPSERCYPEHGFSLLPPFSRSPSLSPLHYNATLPCAMNQTSTVSASRPVVVLMKLATDHFLSRPITLLLQELFAVMCLQGRSVAPPCVKSVILCHCLASVAVGRIYVIP